AEGMFDWGRLKSQVHDPSGGVTVSADAKVDRLDAATVHLGYAFDRALISIDGGAARVRNTRFFDLSGTPLEDPVGNTKSSWTIGAVLEYMFAPGWSWRIAYHHFDFGITSETIGSELVRTPQRIDTVLFAINYRFGGDRWGKAPVVAKY